MAFEDRYRTSTPEGVSLDFVLAGLGSRFIASLVDSAIIVAVVIVVVLAAGALASNGSDTLRWITTGIASLVIFALLFGYFVFFEIVDSGRSPGKRLAGIKVVRLDGGAVALRTSVVRNALRVVDILPSFYLVGAVVILATARNQRLGDVAAGTVIVREKLGAAKVAANTPWGDPRQWAPAPWPGVTTPTAAWLPPELATWDATAVGPAELALVNTFLANRAGYTPQARAALAYDLAGRLWGRVVGPTTAMAPEQFLEAVSMVKSVRG